MLWIAEVQGVRVITTCHGYMTNMNFCTRAGFDNMASLIFRREKAMAGKWGRLLIAGATLLALVVTVYGGGGDLVTVKNFPDFVVAGKPLNLIFTVWVPSLEPLSNLQPSVFATNGKGDEIRAAAKKGKVPGEYRATLIFPEPGEWV